MNGYETMSENYKILMQRGEIEDDDTIDQIMQQLRYIFDGQTAKEVLEAHLA